MTDFSNCLSTLVNAGIWRRAAFIAKSQTGEVLEREVTVPFLLLDVAINFAQALIGGRRRMGKVRVWPAIKKRGESTHSTLLTQMLLFYYFIRARFACLYATHEGIKQLFNE